MDNEPVTQKQFREHSADDARHFKAINEAIAALPTKGDMDKLATRDDMKEVLEIWKNVQLTGRILSGGGKWAWRTILVVAGIIGAVGIITGGLKAVIAGVVSWATFK